MHAKILLHPLSEDVLTVFDIDSNILNMYI